MNNYTFNGEFPTMQDTLCAMTAFANAGQPSYEEQRHFVEMHTLHSRRLTILMNGRKSTM